MVFHLGLRTYFKNYLIRNLTPRKSSYDTGTASELLVMSSLLRQGVDAFITMGNKKNIDIVIKSKSNVAISVDVKAVRGYSSIVVNNVRSAPNHFIVVVIYKGRFKDPSKIPDFYIIPSSSIAGVTSTFNGQLRLMKGQIVKYKDNWQPLLI